MNHRLASHTLPRLFIFELRGIGRREELQLRRAIVALARPSRGLGLRRLLCRRICLSACIRSSRRSHDGTSSFQNHERIANHKISKELLFIYKRTPNPVRRLMELSLPFDFEMCFVTKDSWQHSVMREYTNKIVLLCSSPEKLDEKKEKVAG